MQVNVHYQDGDRFEAIARGHSITCDCPNPHNGSQGAGMNPSELFLASLGSCVGHCVLEYCRSHDIDSNGLDIGVTAEKTTQKPYRIERIQVSLNFVSHLESHHYDGLQGAVENCLIHNTMMTIPVIEAQVSTVVACPVNKFATGKIPAVAAV